ncbi:MAG TPA: metallophosphoesterase family protein [Gammaproteobacteria bacterium]|nr:metallophosphoesterase family protein [Gammaproteobacteria bacterium]
MKKWVKRLAQGFLALLLIYGVGRFVVVYLGSFYTGERAPYLMMPAPNAMTLRWQTLQKGEGQIRYGRSLAKLDHLATEMSSAEEHELRLQGLKPGTRYYYRIENQVDGETAKTLYSGKAYWFMTSPKTGQAVSVRFAVLGDPGKAGKVQTQVREALMAWLAKNPRPDRNRAYLDLLLTTGDNAYRSGTNKQFQVDFFTPYASILKNVPVWPAYGNHDARRWAFFDIFSFPTKAESGGLASGTEHYYSFDYANAHFIMLDTTASSMAVGSKMLNWLQRDLAASKQKWIIAAFHHPPYSHGSHDSDNPHDSGGRMLDVRKNVLPILEAGGADLVLSGHSHMYERSWLMRCNYGDSSTLQANMIREKTLGRTPPYKKPGRDGFSGTVYTVIGSSSKHDQGRLDHPDMPVSLAESGSVVVDIANGLMSVRFITKRGRVADHFSILKTPATGQAMRCAPLN